MSISVHRLTIPVFLRGLAVLSAYLDKAAAFEQEKGLMTDSLAGARLAEDMLPLSGQIQRVTDTAKNAIGRLSATETPRFEDDETTISQLQERIARAVAYFNSVDPGVLDASAAREITIRIGKAERRMSGEDYITTFVLPNFYFHISMAHAILRHEGVAIGKSDYLGKFA